MIQEFVTDEIVDAAVKKTLGTVAGQIVNAVLLVKVANTIIRRIAGQLPINEIIEVVTDVIAPELEPIVGLLHELESYHANARAKIVTELMAKYNLPADVAASLVLAPSPLLSLGLRGKLPTFKL